MDVNKLVQYRMVNGELNPHSPSSDYSVKYVDKHNYLTYLSDIKTVSDIITKQIPDWKDKRFDGTEVAIPMRRRVATHTLF